MKYTISNSNRGQLRDLIMPYVKMSDMEKLRIYYSILAVLDKEKKPDASSYFAAAEQSKLRGLSYFMIE